MTAKKKFVFDVGLTFFAAIITTFIGFILIILLGRYLGADDLGLYRLSTTIYGLSMLFVFFGIPASIIKFSAEFQDQKEKLNQYISSGIISSLLISIILFIVFFSFSNQIAHFFEMPRLNDLIKVIALIFPFAAIDGCLLGLLNGLRKMKRFAGVTIFKSSSMIAITLALIIYFKIGVLGAIIGLVSSMILSSLLLIIVTKKYYSFTFLNFKVNTKKMLKFSVQLFAGDAINEINNHFDIILVGFFLTTTDVGYYTVAIVLSRFFWILPRSVQRITYPATSSYWSKKNHLVLTKMIIKSMKYCTVILVLIGLGVWFFAREIIYFLYNKEFFYSIIPLQILLVGTVIRGSISQPIGGSLTAIGRPDLGLKICVVMMVINVTLDIILIPRIGIIGAAIATTISLVGGAFFNLFFVVRHLKIKFNIKWYSGILAIVLSFVIIFIYGKILINQIAIGGVLLVIYILIIYLLFLKKEDKHFLKSLIISIFSWRQKKDAGFSWNFFKK